MSNTAIILLCANCFCFGLITSAIMADDKEVAGGAALLWLMVILVTLTRALVLL